MIRLNPSPDIEIKCPRCNKSFQTEHWQITGVHSMAYGTCSSCNHKYYQEMPVNAGLFYPGIINAETGKRVDDIPFENWYLNGLEQSYNHKNETEYPVKIEKFREFTRQNVAILNTIDHCYGHSLFELLNASHYLNDPDTDLIILLQEPFRWMAPKGAAQIWTVSIPMSKGGDWFPWLDKKIKEELGSIPNLYLCRSFVQGDSSDYSIEDFTGIKPFDLEKWDDFLDKPVITFIWRSDRFWKPILPKYIDNRITKKVFGNFIQKLKNKKQHQWILEFARSLKKQIPNVDFAIAGMDDQDMTIPSWIGDFRYPKHNDEHARLMCERYAKSHLVIGCNGSSLVLPGCHAGAVINIVPGDAWAVSEGSFPFRITSIGDTHFRYVMVPPEITINRLVNISVSILRDRSLILLHTTDPWRNHKAIQKNSEWAKFRLHSFKMSEYFKNQAGLVTQKFNK